MSSVGSEMPKEIERNRKLLEEYKSIGAAGSFGAIMINQDINAGVEALASGDVVAIVRAYTKLKENES